MPILNKLLLGKYTLATDAVTEAAIKLASLKTANRLRKNLALELLMYDTFGQTQPLIFLDNPRAFNYGDDLMIRGSELLKYPQLYSHMGWFDTKDSPILADQYYKMGNNGFLDPTHFTEFTNSDTYTPIPEQYLQQILNKAFVANGRYGLEKERNKLGSIEPEHEVIYQEPLTPLGTVPGADAAFADYSIHPTDLGADNLRSIYTTTGALPRAVAGMHPAGTAVFAPSMGYDAYNRLVNAKSWKDYVIGGGEGLMTVASLIAPLGLAYRSLRGAINPRYALSKAIDSTPLNVDMLNSYSAPSPLQHYLFSNWQTFGGAYPFEYQVGHIHDIDLSDIGTMLARHGYFDNPKHGKFVLDSKLPSGKTVNLNKVETLPVNYPVQVSANPELPLGYWGKRGNRNVPERVIDSNLVGDFESTNTATISGFVGLDGKIHVTSSYPTSDYTTKSFPVLFDELNSSNPPYDIAGKINKARLYWDTHAIIDNNATPARDPFKRGAKKLYIPFNFSNKLIANNKTTYNSIWNSGKQLTIDYITGPIHKERLMNNLNLTEQEADMYIQLELKNLENVELVNLGQHKIGRKFGHTIGYTVDKLSGLNMFSKVKANSDWMPNQWTELLYEDFILPYEDLARAYNLAKLGVTLVGIAEGQLPAKVNVGFHEGTHATTRGGMDPALAPIIKHDTKLASSLLGLNPGMLDPMEARTFGIELDRAWESLLNNLPEYYLRLSPSAQRKLFFYDILRASDDAGEKFYQSVPKEWAERFDPKYNHILNSGTNGLDPDEALYNFWDKFVYNIQPLFNNIYTT